MIKGLVEAPKAAFPLNAAVLVALCALYLIIGSTGHAPWKGDDAVHLGVAYGFFNGGDWLVPRIAGEPWPGAAPAYHWVAAATGWLTHGFLRFHDGARLASALFGGIFLFALFRAAAALHGREAGLAAPVLAMGTLGLLVPIHDAQPAIAALAAGALAYYGLARQGTFAGALALGAGCGGAFLVAGLSAGMPLLPLLLLPLLQRRWLAFSIAFGVAALFACAWPLALAQQDALYLAHWWREELAVTAPHAKAFGRDHLELLAWFSWPVLPFGLWAAWAGRRQWNRLPLALPLFGTALALGWFLFHDPRPLVALPVLTPLTLLAASGAHLLRRGAANAFDWFGTMTFTLVIGLIWLGGIAMWSGWPQQIARNFAKLQPGFESHFSIATLCAAIAFSAGWAFSLAQLPRSPWRSAIRWSAGVLAMWGVLVALWFPWIDYGKSYQAVAESLAEALPANHGCIERRELGLAQRAVLDYHAGLRTQAPSARGNCRWLLSQGSPRTETHGAGWKKVWEGHRPGDKGERLRLYRRED